MRAQALSYRELDLIITIGYQYQSESLQEVHHTGQSQEGLNKSTRYEGVEAGYRETIRVSAVVRAGGRCNSCCCTRTKE